jgi:hypothetical protein
MNGSIQETAKNTLSAIESKLSGLLKPITPSKEFVSKLGSRMHASPRPVVVDRIAGSQSGMLDRIASLHILAVVAAGILSFFIFLAVVIRALSPRKRVSKA